MAKLTPLRAWNAVQILSGYLLTKWTGKLFHWGMPVSVSIEPTTSCNLRCPQCPSGLRSFSRETGMLEKDFYKETIDQLAPRLTYLILYFQGEPYLNPDFLDMAGYASSKNIYTATSTNAHYLDDENARKTVESGLDRLIISIDGTTQDVYSQYRIGGNLEKVLDGTRKLMKWKKELKLSTPHVIFQFIVFKPNQHQLEDIKALAKELQVDELKIKTAQIYDFENGHELMTDLPEYSRYIKKDEQYALQGSLLNHCWKMWHSCVITWDGKVVPCCFDKDATHRLGTLQENTFSEIWSSPAYNSFRHSLLRSRTEIDICTNCTEGTKVFA